MELKIGEKRTKGDNNNNNNKAFFTRQKLDEVKVRNGLGGVYIKLVVEKINS